jgi:hypothetical protein
MEDDRMTDQAIEIWSKALGNALRCVPPEIREQVLNALLEEERRQLKVMGAEEFKWDAEDSRKYLATKKAVSVMVQVLTRSITNNFSKENAARLLFREHLNGTGSGWLPDYLDGLPGITVDRKKCAAIADGESP